MLNQCLFAHVTGALKTLRRIEINSENKYLPKAHYCEQKRLLRKKRSSRKPHSYFLFVVNWHCFRVIKERSIRSLQRYPPAAKIIKINSQTPTSCFWPVDIYASTPQRTQGTCHPQCMGYRDGNGKYTSIGYEVAAMFRLSSPMLRKGWRNCIDTFCQPIIVFELLTKILLTRYKGAPSG